MNFFINPGSEVPETESNSFRRAVERAEKWHERMLKRWPEVTMTTPLEESVDDYTAVFIAADLHKNLSEIDKNGSTRVFCMETLVDPPLPEHRLFHLEEPFRVRNSCNHPGEPILSLDLNPAQSFDKPSVTAYFQVKYGLGLPEFWDWFKPLVDKMIAFQKDENYPVRLIKLTDK